MTPTATVIGMAVDRAVEGVAAILSRRVTRVRPLGCLVTKSTGGDYEQPDPRPS